jgi:hypothetical protein
MRVQRNELVIQHSTPILSSKLSASPLELVASKVSSLQGDFPPRRDRLRKKACFGTKVPETSPRG